MSADVVMPAHSTSCTPSRAARELGLKRGEFDLAVNLGRIRTVPDENGGGRRVTRTEIDRLRAEDGFPETLLERVRTVGTKEAADILQVPPGRFTRLARLGAVRPVKFYLNRYRAVVWLYLAEEVRQFAADDDNAYMLSGRTPPGHRKLLEEGLDVRARNWRARYVGFLRRQAHGHPWARAAAVASVLDPVEVADAVQDPYERAHLSRFLPRPLTYGAPGSPAAQLTERLMTASDPDEIGWLRADLTHAVNEARAEQPAPRPAPKPRPATAPEQRQPTQSAADRPNRSGPEEPGRPHGLLGWLRRRNP